MTDKIKVAFVCVHNSCRSQMAEAIAKQVAFHEFEAYSAGTEPKDKINPLAVKAIQQLYNINIEQSQFPKLLSDIPIVDVVVTMGCDVSCPALNCKRREDWRLEDPTGKVFAFYLKTAKVIENQIKGLIKNFILQKKQ